MEHIYHFRQYLDCNFFLHPFFKRVYADHQEVNMRPLVFTLEQLAEILQCSVGQARGLVTSGVIRARKLGKTWRIPAHAVETFLAGGDNLPLDQEEEQAVLVEPQEPESEQGPSHPLVDHLRANPNLLDLLEADTRPKRVRKGNKGSKKE